MTIEDDMQGSCERHDGGRMKFIKGMRVELIDRAEVDKQDALHSVIAPVKVGDIGIVINGEYVDNIFTVKFTHCSIYCTASMVAHVPTGLEKEFGIK